MPIHDFHQSFNAGELSPLLSSRTQVEKYASGSKTLINFVPLPQGPVVKRAGTKYVADGYTSMSIPTVSASKVVGFNFADDTYAVFEIVSDSSLSQIRPWSSATVSGTVFSTSWTAVQMPYVQFAQINNIIIAAGDSILPSVITNASGTFSIAEFSYTDLGNYPALLDENVTDTTITPSATTGSITLTASSSIFTSANIGSFYEISHARESTFAEMFLGDTTDYASVTATVSADPADGDTLAITSDVESITAGSFVVGQSYIITSVGTTSFTSIGASANTVGVAFTATGAGTGTGTAHKATIYTFRSAGRDALNEVDIEDSSDDTVQELMDYVNVGGAGNDPSEIIRVERIGGVKATQTIGNNTGTNVSADDRVTIGGVIYKFVANILTGSAAYSVEVGSNLQASLNNLKAAINLDAGSGNTYAGYDPTTGETTQRHPLVEATTIAANGSGYLLTVQTREGGVGGNSIKVGTIRAAGTVPISWTAATLSGGTTVLKFRARSRGTEGNSYRIAETGSAVTLSSTQFSGGTEETDTCDVVVLGKYEVRTSGRWTGTLKLQQKREGSSTYDTIHQWQSKNDYNVNFSAETTRQVTMRLSFTGYGEKIDDVWPRAVLEPVDSMHRGLVKVTAYTSGTVVTATVIRDILSTSATKFWSEGAWSSRRGYPRAVCFHQNRLWLGGTEYEPNKLWASELGNYYNFRLSSKDDGALALQIASTDLQRIEWLASCNGLVIGTSTSEWSAREADGQTAITPTNPPVMRRESQYGSEPHQPVIVGDSVVFIERYGRRVRRMFYDASSGGYVTGNLTALAEHITSQGIVELTLQNRPETVIWCRTGDSNFVCLTYEPEHNVFAWSRQSGTSIEWEGCAAVNGPDGQELWFVAKRSSYRVIARADVDTLNRTASSANAIHLDLTVTASSGTPFTTVAIPDILIGTQCVVKEASGAPYTVTPNASPLTINSTTSVQVGKRITSRMTSMPLTYSMRDGTTAGRAIRPVSLVARVYDSRGGGVMASTFASGSIETLTYPSTSGIYTGDVAHTLRSSWQNDGTVTFFHQDPYPMTLTSLIIRVDTGDAAAHKTINL